jgi:hypothetical protein
MFDKIAELESKLKLPDDFYKNLIKEDDWSFVIKLSTLFEAACTHILSIKLRSPELETAFSFLDQANDKYGKLQLLRKLKALTEEQFKFLKELATLRNKLAHKIENVNFSFEEHLKILNKDQINAYTTVFGYSLNDVVEFEGQCIPKREYFVKNSKKTLWFISADILACLYLEVEIVELEDNQKSLDWRQKNLTS